MYPHIPDPVVEPSPEDPPELTDEQLALTWAGHPWFDEVADVLEIPDIEEHYERPTKLPSIYPSQFTEFAFRMPRADGLGFENFTFSGRRHMKKPYNTNKKRILLVCGRQVEKCADLTSTLTGAAGVPMPLRDIKVGDVVSCLDMSQTPATNMTTGRVSWVSEVLQKPSVRIRTRQGHELLVAETHPLRVWEGWLEAKDARPGLRVASVRRAGEFGKQQIDPRRIELTAFMLGNGGTTQSAYTYSGGVLSSTRRFLLVLESVGMTCAPMQGRDQQYRLHRGVLHDWLKEDGLAGLYSYEKFIPAWVFSLSKDATSLFLNRLWATDGSVKQNNPSKYSIEYSSTSLTLIRSVQALLWKFGIPSSVRENQPSYITVNGDPARLAYILRIETQDGIRTFLEQIGAIGKSEGVPLPTVEENNNRDTYPIEINDLLRRIISSYRGQRRTGHGSGWSLRGVGLRETLKYPPTRGKLIEYYNAFAADPLFDQTLVEELYAHINTELYWDVVESVESVGLRACLDIEVETHHNFLLDGIVTHNSTLLGNIILAYSCIIPAHKTLYVSPSATQTKTFSNDRIKEPIETSPVLKAYTTSMLSQNIFEKQFVNRAKITLRYAFLNADRCAVGSTRVHFVDGSVASLLEIYQSPENFVGRWVWSASRESLSVIPGQLEAVVDQGVRQVFKLRVEGGAENVCTENQPLLTWDGWKRVDQLSVGDFVAVPRRTAHGMGTNTAVEEYRLIGHLLGERQGIFGGSQGYKKRLRELGLIGKNHATKRVPSELFKGNEVQIRNLLGAIYATDGWASVSGNQFEIGYCSNSVGLLHDLKVLLLRFGIQSWVSKQKRPSTVKAQGAYVLSIRAAASVISFCNQIPVLGKEEEFEAVYKEAEKVHRLKDDADRIPLSYASLRQYLLQTYGLSTHTAWTRHRIQLRPDNKRDSVGRRVLSSIAQKLGDAYLQALAMSELGWARLEEISNAGRQRTFDLTISATENYLVDGLFIHNTRGIPAWCLAIDELQDVLADNIPVIEQCTSHAPEMFKRFLYAGTPKGLDNTIEYYRSGVSKDGKPMSTQCEWAVPCEAHGGETGRYWNILGEKNIGKNGLICESCGKPIESMHPESQWTRQVHDGIFESFRIPQLMVPWRNWEDILLDYSRYGRDKFYNEVLGVSYDSGMRPLSLANIQECCSPELTMHPAFLEQLRKSLRGMNVFGGIDWGCHDDQTRILTENGFKYFKDLIDDDKVAQWDPETRLMTFVAPLARTVRDWDQPLLRFETRGGLDLMVTHTHRMRVGVQQGERWLTESAGDLSKRGGNVHFVGHVEWEGSEVSSFVLPGVPAGPGYRGSEDQLFNMDDWLELLGYLLTEGGLCFDGDRPSCLKMSQRESANPGTRKNMQECLNRCKVSYSTFPNPNTSDVNWTIYGKQWWSWYQNKVGTESSEKRVPRQFLNLSKRQLKILFDALVAGDGTVDEREGCQSGAFYSTSKGLCEDFQEICIRLGMRCLVRLHKPAEGNHKTRWRALWSRGRDFQFNTPSSSIERVPYNGKVYCCAVPRGYIVTERNGCISYQGNTGENSYTVACMGYYIGNRFRIFWMHRFTGEDVDPQLQVQKIIRIFKAFGVRIIGSDYGGGFSSNNILMREFGPVRVQKFQYAARAKKKVFHNPLLQRWIVHRTEVMSDVFAAIKRKAFEFPRMEEFREPYAQDMLNIHSEYNNMLRMIQYNHRPDRPDDAFHALLYCFLASMVIYPRPDIIVPKRELPTVGPQVGGYTGPLDQG